MSTSITMYILAVVYKGEIELVMDGMRSLQSDIRVQNLAQQFIILSHLVCKVLS